MLGHDLPHYTSVGFPFFLVFALVVLEEVVVRSENREFCIRDFAVDDLCRNSDVTVNRYIRPLMVLVRAIIMYHNRQNRAKTCKSTLFELDKVFTIRCSTLWVYDQWWKLASLACYLSLTNLFQYALLRFLVVTMDIQPAGACAYGSDKW